MLWHTLSTAMVIGSFVAASMLVVEYLNVLSAGRWTQRLMGRQRSQYVLAALLGATPGCLGTFTVVTLYTHGTVGLGALVAATVASCGDEAFVMLAMFPQQAVAIFAVLTVVGIVAGALTGRLFSAAQAEASGCLQVHREDTQLLLSPRELARAWRDCSPARGTLALLFGAFLTAVVSGVVAGTEPSWIRVTLGLAAGFALFVVCTVPDHFLEEHLWRHVIRKHLPGVFLWTAGVLLALELLAPLADWPTLLEGNRWWVLAMACLLGIVPESGPHLIFVTLFAQGLIPPSVLVASSIVQDGHGMLPLLAHSRMTFLRVKAINLAVGALVGAAMMVFGF